MLNYSHQNENLSKKIWITSAVIPVSQKQIKENTKSTSYIINLQQNPKRMSDTTVYQRILLRGPNVIKPFDFHLPEW